MGFVHSVRQQIFPMMRKVDCCLKADSSSLRFVRNELYSLWFSKL